MKQITIIDYGSGNVLSAQQSFMKVIEHSNMNANVIISNDIGEIKKSSYLVLPGQGAFKTCINGIKKIPGLHDEILEFVLNKKNPFLGICVGMQMLATDSEENGMHKGLGLIDGHIKKLPNKNLKMPHMGWNDVIPTNNNSISILNNKNDFYFVHSYYFDCNLKENILAETLYGITFPSIVGKENIYGVQFHPEKSSIQGLKLIKEFLK